MLYLRRLDIFLFEEFESFHDVTSTGNRSLRPLSTDSPQLLALPLHPTIPHLSLPFRSFSQNTPRPPQNSLQQVLPRPISKIRGKKRSSRACATCRARKVRCNIVAHGAPCSNCRHDEIECVLPLSRRQKYVSQFNLIFSVFVLFLEFGVGRD